jgi:PncC family amidohydrolase
VAESLTGGLVAATIVSVPGASAVLRGGVVAYATDVKASVLGVDPGLLARVGAVDADVADAMAEGVARLLGADYGVATTGVAGPSEQDGKPVGTVFVAIVGPDDVRQAGGDGVVRELWLRGNRERIRQAAVTTALDMLRRVLGGLDQQPVVSVTR